MKKYNNISCIYKCEAPEGKIYVGATCDYERRLDQYRVKDGLKYQRLLRESVEKHGLDSHKFSILEYCDRVDLYKREIYWVGRLNSYYYNNSLGLNLTLGGSGSRGAVVSDKVKKQISERNSKKVYKYSIDGKFIKEYSSTVEAAIEHNITPCVIGHCINKTRHHKTAAGFIWSKTKEESVTIKYKVIYKEKIVQLDVNGNYINTFENIKEAGDFNNIVPSNISRCVRGLRKTAGGFKWMLLKEYELKQKYYGVCD